MRNILFAFFALLVMGVGSAKAEKFYADLSKLSNGPVSTWNGATNTMTWTGTSNNMISNFSFSAGDYSSYTDIAVTVSELSEAEGVRIQVRANGKEPWILLKGNGSFKKSLTSDFKLTTEDLKSFEWARLLGSQDKGGSARIDDVYLERPTSLYFNAMGKAVTNKALLTASGGLSYDSSTGVLTSDGTAGTLTLEFDSPIDLRNLKSYEVKRTGGNDGIISRVCFYEEGAADKFNSWTGSKLGNGGLDNNATNSFIDHTVKKLVWESDANASNNEKSFTITEIVWQMKTMTCIAAGETQLNTLPWIKISSGNAETPAWNMYDTDDTFYGDYSGNATHYVDLTAYSELRVYCNSSTDGFRCFFIKSDGSGTDIKYYSDATWHEEGKYYSLDLSSITKWVRGTDDEIVALKAMKSQGGGKTRFITNIVAYQTPAANAPKYTLSGCGMQLAATVAALADATNTSIDATAVTGITTNSEKGQTELVTANPNCLIYGSTGDGKLKAGSNIVEEGTCANLVLTEGYPFAAPADFTATAATLNRSIAAGAFATVCAPFAITGGANGTFYQPTSLISGTLNFGTEASPAAGKAYLYKASSAVTALTGSGTVKAAPVDNGTGVVMRGTFTNLAEVPTDDYVLSGTNLYKVNSTVTLAPFRAYFTIPAADSKANVISLNFDKETNIESLSLAPMGRDGEGLIYNLAGQRMSKFQKGVNIINGKKVLVK